MYWTFTLLLCFSATFAYQLNIKIDPPFIKRFYRTVIFGDSTSDTGNVYELTDHTWPIVPPYYQGQFCNGPNWADRLNVPFKLNYAYGSATTDNNLVKGYTKLNTVLVPGMLQQVDQYLNATETPFDFLPTVYILWGGANDAVFNQSLGQNPILIVSSLMNSVEALLIAGAKTIIVFNQEPFQAVPQNSVLNQPQLYTYLTTVSNNAINSSLQALQATYPHASIYLFDLHSLITNLLANPPPPITNIVNNCWEDYNITTVIQNCSDPKTYFFVDPLHFSSTVQQKLAEAADPFFLRDFKPNSPGSYFHSY